MNSVYLWWVLCGVESRHADLMDRRVIDCWTRDMSRKQNDVQIAFKLGENHNICPLHKVATNTKHIPASVARGHSIHHK